MMAIIMLVIVCFAYFFRDKYLNSHKMETLWLSLCGGCVAMTIMCLLIILKEGIRPWF